MDDLSALRARAYGRGAAPLSAEDAARLAELERAQRAPVVADAVGAAAPVETPPPPGAPLPPARRRSAWLLAGAAVLLLVLGVATGYALSAVQRAPAAAPTPTSTPLSLPDGALASRDRVAARQPWDDGSLRLITWIDGASYWWGTRSDGSLTCLASDGDDVIVTCLPTDEVRARGMVLTATFFDADTGLNDDETEISFDPYGTGQLYVRHQGG